MNNCYHFEPPFGDQLLVAIDLNYTKPKKGSSIHRDWCRYTSQILVSAVQRVNFGIDCDNVHQHWYHFENLLIDQIDKILHLTEYIDNCAPKIDPYKWQL
jgi:hypothetical protein